MGAHGGSAWERLYTPHRMAYLKGDAQAPAADASCPFCVAPGLPDDEGLVVVRGERAFVVMNLYPYNSGHLMVCPYRHVAEYVDLDADEVAEIGALTQAAMRTLRSVSGAQGFNIGMNQGRAGGAGIADHLHQHVVPRWGGDTNFLPVIGGTKTIPQLLEDTRALLAERWER